MAPTPATQLALGTARGPNLYNILQIPQDATPQGIIASYHALAVKMKEHDLSYDEPTEAERQTKERNLRKLDKAFQILSNPLERMRYDAAVLRRQISISVGSHWTPSKRRGSSSSSSREGDSWIAARDGRDWPTPPRRTVEGRRYVRYIAGTAVRPAQRRG
ncbi:hypothetical protein BST61_g7739 [Cercospora zeina]